MTRSDRQKALDDLMREYSDLAKQHAEIAERMAKIRPAINALAALEDNYKDAYFDLTLTTAIKTVLLGESNALTATEIRDQLAEMGYDLSQHNNPLASIHSVLKRLCEAEAAEQVFLTEGDGKARYRAVKRSLGEVWGFKPRSLYELANLRPEPVQAEPPPGLKAIADSIVKRRRLPTVGEPPPEPPRGMQKVLADSIVKRRRLTNVKSQEED